MSIKIPRRTAVTAALATVGGLVVPLLGAGAANAATQPTGVTVTPSAAYAAQSGSADFTVNLTGGDTYSQNVMFAVTSGPDSNAAQPLLGSNCTPASGISGPYTCTVANTSGQPGVDHITFFYDAAGTGSYQSGDPSATATMTIGGAVNSISITPTGAQTAQGVYQEYTLNATDAQGRPVTGATLNVTATQSNAASADLSAIPDVTTQPAALPATPTAGTNGTTTATPTTAAGGKAVVWITSTQTGTVNILASDGPAVSSAATLTVNPGTVNDVTTVTANPASQTAYVSHPVTVTVTLTNSAGNPVANVTPSATVSGVNAGAAVTATPSDSNGQSTLTYSAGATAGNDTLSIWVNKTTPGHTAGKDADEAGTTATVTLQAEDIGSFTGQGTTVPNGTMSASVTFTVKKASDGTPASGVALSFSVPVGSGYTLSSTSGTTDSNGQATVTVTASDAAHATNTSVVVTAKVTQDPAKVATATVTWEARSPSNTVITPFASTNGVGGTTSFSASTTDQFGAPVSGLTYTWTVTGDNNSTNNVHATGTGSTFSYTDSGSSTGGVDHVTVTATDANNVSAGSDTVNQYWVVGTAQASQANLDLPPTNGYYGSAPNYVPTGFTKSYSTGTTSDPSSSGSADVVPVEMKLVDAHGNPLFGKQVTFSTSGVGGFTDSTGHPLASPSSATARVCDSSGANGETEDTCWDYAAATVFVRSSQAGTETITATVDGLTDTATVTYSGQYVAVTPHRVADTRSGQGSIITWGGGNAPARLAPNTNYYFAYGATDMPQYQAAYAFNITAIDASSVGNLRVVSNNGCGQSATPATSLINYQPGKTVANFVVVPNVGECGDNGLVIYSDNASVSVAIDLLGYYPGSWSCNEGMGCGYFSPDAIRPVTPTATRVVDTRSGLGGGTPGPVAAGTSRSFQIAGNAGIPSDGSAKAVALNVVAVGPTGVGNLRIYPDGSPVPNASSINYIKGVDKAAFVVVNLPANGKIDVYSDGSPVNVVIDAYDWYPTTANLVTQAPQRILDTRQGTALAANVPMNVQVGGKGGVPADAQAVLVTLTSIHNKNSTGVGNLRIFPAGAGIPTVSTLNYVSKTTDVANFALVRLGTNGQVTLFSDGSPIDAAIDVVGWIPAGS